MKSGLSLATWRGSFRVGGAGRRDLLARYPDGTMEVWLSDGQRLNFSHSFRTNFKDEWGWGNGLRYFLMDINGDGKTDLVARQDDGLLYILLSDGSQLVRSGTLQTGFRADWGWNNGVRYFPMDLDGDGKTDLLARPFQTSFRDDWGWNDGYRYFPMDINGDGKTDMLTRNRTYGTFDLFLSNGSTLALGAGALTPFDSLGAWNMSGSPPNRRMLR